MRSVLLARAGIVKALAACGRQEAAEHEAEAVVARWGVDADDRAFFTGLLEAGAELLRGTGRTLQAEALGALSVRLR